MGVLCTVLVLLTAGWLLQERVTAPSLNDLGYSELCRFIDEGKVDLVVIKGQAVESDFFEQQQIAGHKTKLFRATAPTNAPSFWPLVAREEGPRSSHRRGAGSASSIGARGGTACGQLGVPAARFEALLRCLALG